MVKNEFDLFILKRKLPIGHEKICGFGEGVGRSDLLHGIQ